MNLTIENFTSITGWVASDDTVFEVHGINQIKEFIANDLSGSLILHSNNGSGETLTKTFTEVDVTDYDELTLSVYSTRIGNAGWYYNDLSDFKYKIRFNSTMDYYMLPTFSSLQAVTFDISSITSIDRIQIMCNHSSEDYLVLSWCVAVKDQLPLDIFSSLKTALENKRDDILGDGYSIQTISAITGDTELYFDANVPYVEKYACVKIDDGANSEVHQLHHGNELDYKMTSMYDGKSILNDYTDANCYISPRVEYGQEREIAIPCIFISNLAPRVDRSAKIEYDYDSYVDDRTVSERVKPQILKFDINIDCISRHNEILADLSEIIRKFIANEVLWVNGKKFDLYFNADPVFQDFDDVTEIYPKITYVMEIEVKEYFVDRAALPNTTTVTTTLNIEE
jgi:hypothetical protein